MVPWFQMQRITNDNNYDSCCFPNLGTPRWKDYMMDIKRIIKQKHNRYPSFGISLIQNYWDNGYPGGVPTGAWSHHSLGTRAPRFGAALGEASAFAFALAFALAFPVAALALGMGMDFERASIVTDSWALSRAATVPRYVWYKKKGLLCFQSMGCSYIWSHNHIYTFLRWVFLSEETHGTPDIQKPHTCFWGPGNFMASLYKAIRIFSCLGIIWQGDCMMTSIGNWKGAGTIFIWTISCEAFAIISIHHKHRRCKPDKHIIKQMQKGYASS